MHVVLVDNGRSERLGMEKFWPSLKCIRCGACMNTCPCFGAAAVSATGATYAGPIGIILDPTFNAHKCSKLPFSSTLNGSCASVCPVKINIHEQIADWRKVMSETHELPLMKKAMMQAAGVLLSSPALYRAALPAADSALRHLPRFIVYNRLNTWGRGREVPHAPKQTFHQWYKENRGASRRAAVTTSWRPFAHTRQGWSGRNPQFLYSTMPRPRIFSRPSAKRWSGWAVSC